MSRVVLSARVTQTQSDALRAYAAQAGLPFYQATVRALEAGIAILAGSPDADAAPQVEPVNLDRIEEGLGLLQAHIERIGQMSERALFAAGASYAAGVVSAKSAMTPDERKSFDDDVAREADRIFARQLAIARGG